MAGAPPRISLELSNILNQLAASHILLAGSAVRVVDYEGHVYLGTDIGPWGLHWHYLDDEKAVELAEAITTRLAQARAARGTTE
jgi:hypothetical protein